MRYLTTNPGQAHSTPSSVHCFQVGATIATYPLIVVKSRLQAGSKSGDPRLRYTSAFDAVLRIWEHEGLGGFFGGIQAKIFQTAIGEDGIIL